jgi:hypothetical protein
VSSKTDATEASSDTRMVDLLWVTMRGVVGARRDGALTD